MLISTLYTELNQVISLDFTLIKNQAALTSVLLSLKIKLESDKTTEMFVKNIDRIISNLNRSAELRKEANRCSPNGFLRKSRMQASKEAAKLAFEQASIFYRYSFDLFQTQTKAENKSETKNKKVVYVYNTIYNTNFIQNKKEATLWQLQNKIFLTPLTQSKPAELNPQWLW